ncbi:MAPEG family protein [Rhodalgimonas zhirmunskyi]|uniref:MAPEG family protein n=1 Tax=Rhodalgimonas zhirmunskyi TaxID=2964767 RepID=A0AAJ1U7T1_9RHOB|nr:MAPEG family protein [Rhodoalgimonas zhirmunskyi]MDQ2092883.1 MAPEG family protein [Rhodoalgimonas zhirmunskyi]
MIGMALGLAWGMALIFIGTVYVRIPIFSFNWMLALAFLLAAIVPLLVIARQAARRFFDDTLIDGQPYLPGSPGDIDARVLQNSIEQLVLAMAVWPAAGTLLVTSGPGVVLMLGGGFLISRLAFWGGYHLSPPLRAFGFAASFYPTIIVLVWALAIWII